MTYTMPREGVNPTQSGYERIAQGEISVSEPLQQVVARFALEHIDPASLDLSEERHAASIIGEEYASFTKQALQRIRRISRKPDTENPFLIVPGTTEAGLRTYFHEVGDNLHSSDKVRRRRALQFQQPFYEYALHMSRHYPEVQLAERAESEWYDKDWITASESAAIVIASYGLRLSHGKYMRR